ncbi:NAD-dependent malic enzyme (NAD-ME) [Staphylococcus aureus]|uniref:NAD-dependent malic enzyme (NAD-ME) n=1 Tax=Staphylococcus aureus TaxID=1280 RepID=A0A380E2N4_STAAU|nr:NAD-dependent malic enzyme (NAD-ME) [Staphylococcus aureus]
MEGKAVLFKSFAGINGVPIALIQLIPKKSFKTVKLLEPNYGGINLEDISAPRCFEIEERLKKKLIFRYSMTINMVQQL